MMVSHFRQIRKFKLFWSLNNYHAFTFTSPDYKPYLLLDFRCHLERIKIVPQPSTSISIPITSSSLCLIHIAWTSWKTSFLDPREVTIHYKYILSGAELQASVSGEKDTRINIFCLHCVFQSRVWCGRRWPAGYYRDLQCSILWLTLHEEKSSLPRSN